MQSISAAVAEAQTPVASAGAQGQAPGFVEVLMNMLPMFVMVYFIFYFLVTKPQQQKLRDQEKLMNDLKKGDLVVTSSGLIGRVAAKEKDHILLEVAANTKVKFELGAVTKRFETKGEEKSDKTKVEDKAV